MWEILRDRRLGGIKFRRQSPISIFIPDFYCPELKLVVEIDGIVHADDRQVAHDQNRDVHLRALGCTVLRFADREIFNDREAVLAQITETALRLREGIEKQTSASTSSSLSCQGEGDRG